MDLEELVLARGVLILSWLGWVDSARLIWTRIVSARLGWKLLHWNGLYWVGLTLAELGRAGLLRWTELGSAGMDMAELGLVGIDPVALGNAWLGSVCMSQLGLAGLHWAVSAGLARDRLAQTEQFSAELG